MFKRNCKNLQAPPADPRATPIVGYCYKKRSNFVSHNTQSILISKILIDFSAPRFVIVPLRFI